MSQNLGLIGNGFLNLIALGSKHVQKMMETDLCKWFSLVSRLLL